MKKYLMTVMAAVALGGLFIGCSSDADLSGGNTAEFNILKNYEDAFITRFGQPYEDQTWGFGESVAGTRSGNTSGDYTPWPYTHGYEDANGKLIASANMNHNQWGSTDLQSMPYGGWIVPDPLTEGQKLRVQKYFQANPNLEYKDPQYANFFVQQVYTGGTDAPTTGNHETTVGADGQGHKGMTLNQLTVGQAASHINDFNAGTCTTSQVLNHEGKTQSDQITLMLNVDDTSCFGFHETSGSNVNSNENSNVYNHNDKMALVSAAVIDAWAAQNGNPGEAVVDKWNRSFMGFDYELLPEADIVTDDYAMLSNWDGNLPEYAWDGQTVMKIGQKQEVVETGEQVDLTSKFSNAINGTMTTNDNGGISFTSNQNDNGLQCDYFGYDDVVKRWSDFAKFVIVFKEATTVETTLQLGNDTYSIAAGTTSYEVDLTGKTYQGGKVSVPNGKTVIISRIYLETGAEEDNEVYYTSQYLLAGGTNQISFYSTNTNMYGGVLKSVSSADMTTIVDGKTCINLKWIKDELYDKGYHPISTDLKTWVKWQAACDGYYSDWIVTLTKAERITPPEDPPYNPPTEPDDIVCRIIVEDLTVGESSDFDFNDVVFDVCHNGTLIIRAIGGELPIYIGEENANEVHAECSITLGDTDKGKNSYMYMRNTGWTSSGGKASADIKYDDILGYIYLNRTFNEPADALEIGIWVHKNGKNIKLQAPKGKVASMVCVGTDYEWCAERQDIDKKFHTKSGVKLFSGYVRGQYKGRWQDKDGWYHHVNDE